MGGTIGCSGYAWRDSAAWGTWTSAVGVPRDPCCTAARRRAKQDLCGRQLEAAHPVVCLGSSLTMASPRGCGMCAQVYAGGTTATAAGLQLVCELALGWSRGEGCTQRAVRRDLGRSTPLGITDRGNTEFSSPPFLYIPPVTETQPHWQQ